MSPSYVGFLYEVKGSSWFLIYDSSVLYSVLQYKNPHFSFHWLSATYFLGLLVFFPGKLFIQLKTPMNQTNCAFLNTSSGKVSINWNWNFPKCSDTPPVIEKNICTRHDFRLVISKPFKMFKVNLQNLLFSLSLFQPLI